jgi:ornithine carbamoyltransferase
MDNSLKGRSLLSLLDLSAAEILFLLALAAELKAAKRNGTERQRLRGKNIALIFEKPSTRTRCAFEVAAFDQGAQVSYLGPTGTQIGVKESMRDTARVLARLYDAIEYRGFAQATVEELAAHGVPVWNGLTDAFHPTQVLADLLTMREHGDKPLEQVSFCYLGDGRGNMGHSLLVAAARLGMDLRMAVPPALAPDAGLLARAGEIAAASGARITVTDEIPAAVHGVDFIYTDVWVSMGEPDSAWAERIGLLRPFQVNRAVLELTGNPGVKFMHCLPAFHNRETRVGEEIFQRFGLEALEVTDEVFESPCSVVFDQAENRMHTIKAVMVATLGD